MRILVLRSTIASGQAFEAGSICDVSEEDAAILLRMGKATTDLPEPPKPARKATKEAP